MIRLNDRLQAIADRLHGVKTMADIGTDHGFLPVFLVQQGICDSAILTDISAASLSKAEECCRRELSGGYELRVGDGLSVLNRGEVDAAVIAGVGGALITELMERDMELTCSIHRFVLQPRNGQGKLRRWLCDNGFAIIGDDVALEGAHIPEIITALPPGEELRLNTGEAKLNDDMARNEASGKDLPCEGSDIYYRIPPWILHGRGPVGEFIRRALEKEKLILENITLAHERDRAAETERCMNIRYIENILEGYEYERKDEER